MPSLETVSHIIFYLITQQHDLEHHLGNEKFLMIEKQYSTDLDIFYLLTASCGELDPAEKYDSSGLRVLLLPMSGDTLAVDTDQKIHSQMIAKSSLRI